ncbi:efflux RND transporter periplasmic adaptor subunit [Tepidibacillus marianensis]|uniref:HlyD family secretion protein n=1 Tax=Tepidibacillus marianensis TaxID=3131995 RepID=UPI0030D13CE4
MKRIRFALLILSLIFVSFGCAQQENSNVYSGTLEGDEIPILSEVSGTVTQLPLEEGVRVKKGDLLAKIDDRMYQAQLKEAQNGVKAAKATYDDAKKGTDSLYYVWQQAIAKEDQIKLQLDKTKITSPIDGIIIRKNISLQENLKPNYQLYTLLDPAKLKVKVYIPEANLNQVKIGQQAQIRVDAYPNRTFKGKVTSIAEQAEFTPQNVQTPDERTKLVFEVTVQPTEGLNELKPGMPSDLTFTEGEQK